MEVPNILNIRAVEAPNILNIRVVEAPNFLNTRAVEGHNQEEECHHNNFMVGA